MKWYLGAVGLMVCSGVALADVSCDVPGGFWLTARSGQKLLQEAALKPCWLAAGPQSRFKIEYYVDESNTLNASELKNWMTAVGIPSKRIQMVENKNASMAIRVAVVQEEEK